MGEFERDHTHNELFSAWVAGVRTGRTSAKLLLFVLAHHSDARGITNMGFKAFAKDCSLSIFQVRKGLKSLKKQNLISVEKRDDANLYVILHMPWNKNVWGDLNV